MKTRTLMLSCITTFCLSFMGNALADWSATFRPPTSDSPKLIIDLPDDLDVSILSTLGIELDGIDITSYLSFEGGRDFSFIPVEPLQNGEHSLRLVIINADGNSEEKIRWTFNIENTYSTGKDTSPSQQQLAASESWLRSASFEADTLTEFSHRFSQNNIGVAPDRSIISGGGNISSFLQGENWSFEAQTNFLVQSDRDLTLTENIVDIGEYKISADYIGEKIKTGFTLGHHDVGLQSILFSSFQRRGASVRLDVFDNRIAANLFAFRPETQTGVRDFTGLTDEDNRLEGASISITPFSNENDALKVTGIYYDGSGSTGGIGINGEEENSTGSGWGVIVEKNILQGLIDFRGEYAHSVYDADGDSDIAPEDNSDAISLGIALRPFGNPNILSTEADIVIGSTYERIDTFFSSLGNRGLAADRDAVSAYTSMYWGGFSSNIQLTRETNNVDNLAGLPTDKLQTIVWDTNYAFEPQGILGTPYMGLSGFVAKLDRHKTPSGFEGFDTDNTTKSLTLSIGSFYESFNWSASHTYAEFYDRANTSSDTINNLSSLVFGWTVSEQLNVMSNLQYGTFDDKDSGTTTYNTNMILGLRSVLIPDILNLDLDYNLNFAGGLDDSPDKHILNGELGWAIRQARRNHPGLTFAIRGSMETSNGNTNTITNTNISDETQYQVFAVLRITAPLSAGF